MSDGHSSQGTPPVPFTGAELGLDQRRRYSRQIRLVDIGEPGQAKLCAARVELSTRGFARVVEERYVHAAGMNVTRAGEVAEPHSEPMHLVEELSGAARLGLRHTPAFEVADGAFRALVAVRTALGMTS